jgi:hypothetical protein
VKTSNLTDKYITERRRYGKIYQVTEIKMVVACQKLEDNVMLKRMIKGKFYSKKRKDEMARQCQEWSEEDGESMEREDEE